MGSAHAASQSEWGVGYSQENCAPKAVASMSMSHGILEKASTRQTNQQITQKKEIQYPEHIVYHRVLLEQSEEWLSQNHKSSNGTILPNSTGGSGLSMCSVQDSHLVILHVASTDKHDGT